MLDLTTYKERKGGREKRGGKRRRGSGETGREERRKEERKKGKMGGLLEEGRRQLSLIFSLDGGQMDGQS